MKKFKRDKELVFRSKDILINSLKILNEVLKNINILIKAETNINFKRLTQVKSLELNNFEQVYNNHAITEKADGDRYGVYFDENGYMYRFGRDLNFEKIDQKFNIKKTLIDTEYINGTYYVFDIMINNGNNVMTKNLNDRYQLLNDLNFDYIYQFTYYIPNEKILSIKMNYTKIGRAHV